MEPPYICEDCGIKLDGHTGDWYDRKFRCPECRIKAIAQHEDEKQQARDDRERDIKRIVKERHCSRAVAEEISYRNW